MATQEQVDRELTRFLTRVAKLTSTQGMTAKQREEIVKFFQDWRDIDIDGKVGPQTLGELGLETMPGLDTGNPTTGQINVFGSVPCKLTSAFGPRSSGMHKGVDFAAYGVVPLYSIVEGKVTQAGGSATNSGDCRVGDAGCGGGWGNFVTISTATGLVRYAHLATNSIPVRPGDMVKPGQMIGKQGNTGGSRGPHLHLEYIPHGGSHVDPVGLLIDKKGFML